MPPQEVAENIYAMSAAQRQARGIEALPANLMEAVSLMRQDSLVAQTLGSHIMNHYTRGKEKEWEDYRVQVSQWELDKYLVLY